jgi:hypothetical protein
VTALCGGKAAPCSAKPHGIASRSTSGSGASYSRFEIHDLLLQQIGFDRSAFAASRHEAAGQSKSKEPSRCSIHGEGLLEHPIKN